MLSREYQLALELAQAFVDALHVIHEVETLFKGLVRHKVYEKIHEDVVRKKALARAKLHQVESDFPLLYNAMQTTAAIRKLLHFERRSVEKLRVEGIITESEKKKMLYAVRKKMYYIEHNEIDTQVRLSSKDVVSQMPCWQNLTLDLKRRILNSKRVPVENGHVVGENTSGAKVYYIMQGMVKVHAKASGETRSTLGIGDFYGVWCGLTNHKFTDKAVSKSDPLLLLQLDKKLINQMTQIPEVFDIFWRSAAAELFTVMFPEVFKKSRRQTLRICQHGVLKQGTEAASVTIRGETIVLLMAGSTGSEEKRIEAPAVLSTIKSARAYELSKDAVYIEIDNRMSRIDLGGLGSIITKRNEIDLMLATMSSVSKMPSVSNLVVDEDPEVDEKVDFSGHSNELQMTGLSLSLNKSKRKRTEINTGSGLAPIVESQSSEEIERTTSSN